MLTPVGWHHYLVLLAIPFVQMVASATEDRSSSRAIWMAALAYFLSAISLRAFSRFMVPPPTAFQLALPWLARALEETSFVALLTGYIAAYWFATDQFRVPATDVARLQPVIPGCMGKKPQAKACATNLHCDRLETEHSPQLHCAEAQHRLVADFELPGPREIPCWQAH